MSVSREGLQVQGGWGGPPGGGYGPPPGGGGYGPPPGGGFGGPPGGFGGPPPGGGYGAPPGGFGGPPGGYGAPPGGFGGPPGGFGGPGFGGPGFGPPGMGPGGPPPPELQSQLNTWFIVSIVAIFFGCCLTGIIATVMMNGAKQAFAQGNYLEAQSKLGTAKTVVIIGFVLAALGFIGNVLTAIANG